MRKGTLSLRTWGRTDAELFEQQLCAERNRWDIERRKSGSYLGTGLVSRQDADRRFRALMRAQFGGRASDV